MSSNDVRSKLPGTDSQPEYLRALQVRHSEMEWPEIAIAKSSLVFSASTLSPLINS